MQIVERKKSKKNKKLASSVESNLNPENPQSGYHSESHIYENQIIALILIKLFMTIQIMYI